ncbi:MAG: anaerobic ribonucleoside-triphosphate reductase activating protein [Treponemataceae bacterium]
MKNYILPASVQLGAIVKTSLSDFPHCVSAVLFFHGCNLRCPYCYNRDLVIGSVDDYESISMDFFMDFLERRKNVLTGIVFSGGEPLLNPHLSDLIIFAKSLGYKIKLDTNGTLPDRLEKIMSNPLTQPDYISLDIKTSLSSYSSCTTENVTSNLLSSIRILKKMPTHRYEFRTVLVPTLIDKAAIQKLAPFLPSDAQWYFSPFLNKNCLDKSFEQLSLYSIEEINDIVHFAQKLLPNAKLR